MNREEKIEAIASAIAALAAEHGEDNLFTREEVAERCDLKTKEIAEIGTLHFGDLQAAVTKNNAAIRLLRYAPLPMGGARMFVTGSASSNDRTGCCSAPTMRCSASGGLIRAKPPRAFAMASTSWLAPSAQTARR